jgi:hypothetical protein
VLGETEENYEILSEYLPDDSKKGLPGHEAGILTTSFNLTKYHATL